MTKALPKKIYIKVEKSSDGTEYFVADTNMIGMVDIGEKVKIGVYQLVETTTAEGIVKVASAKA